MVHDWRCCLLLFEKPPGNFGEYLASPHPSAQGGDSLLISLGPQSTYLPFLVQCVGVSGCKEPPYCSWALSIQISMFLAMNFQQERSYSQKLSKGAISVYELCLIKKLMGNNIWIRRFEEAHKKEEQSCNGWYCSDPALSISPIRRHREHYLNVLSHWHDFTMFVGGWKMYPINECSWTLLKLIPLSP